MGSEALRWLLVGVVSGLLACGAPSRIDEDEMPQSLGRLYCERLAECDRGNYLLDYYGMSDCAEHQRRLLVEIADLADDIDCSYDDKGAARAWEDLATMDCDDFYEGDFNDSLNKAWDECDLSFFF